MSGQQKPSAAVQWTKADAEIRGLLGRRFGLSGGEVRLESKLLTSAGALTLRSALSAPSDQGAVSGRVRLRVEQGDPQRPDHKARLDLRLAGTDDSVEAQVRAVLSRGDLGTRLIGGFGHASGALAPIVEVQCREQWASTALRLQSKEGRYGAQVGAKAAGTLQHAGLIVGGSVALWSDSEAVCSLGAGYRARSFAALVRTRSNLGRVLASYWHDLRPGQWLPLRLGAQVDLSTRGAADVLTLGAEGELFTGTRLKGKVDSRGHAALALRSTVAPGLRVDFAARFGRSTPVGLASVGLAFTLGDF
jgi:Eukaryotic porin